MNDKYLRLSDPQCIRDQFISDKDFENWLRIDFEGTHVKDLEESLQAFLNEEMYHECAIIKKVLDEVLFNYHYPISSN